MNLLQITKVLKEKEKSRNKLLGQKEMLMDSLKKLGFKNLGQAKKESHKLKNQLIKMKAQYTDGEEKFKNKYAHLLE